MKPLIYISSLLCCASLHAQEIRLAGTLPAQKNNKLELSNLSEQKWTIAADENGKFSQAIPDAGRGFYALTGVGSVYLEPGFNLQIAKKEEQTAFQGKGSKENNLMVLLNANARKISESMSNGEMNFVELPGFIKQLETWKKGQYKLIDQQKASQWFSDLRKMDVDYTVRALMREYVYNYGIDMKKRANFFGLLEKMAGNFNSERIDSARKEMEVKKLTKEEKNSIDSIADIGSSMNNEELFKASATYRKWIDNEVQTMMYTKYREDFNKGLRGEAIKFKIVNNEISNPFIKSYMSFRMASMALKMSDDLPEADSIYNAFTTSSSNKAHNALMEEIYQKIKKFSKGAPAPEFVYNTVSGEKVSLSSLKGNLVYIDVWATWCGPCKAEIPHLKKVEEAYHDKAVKFVSISVDELKDAEKWKSYVTDNHLKGVQLMADNAFNSAFIKDFNIAAIPRFILIDKEGKIISANALRPSNKKLAEELNKHLAL